jgi:hypothetical protein
MIAFKNEFVLGEGSSLEEALVDETCDQRVNAAVDGGEGE